MMTLSLSKDEGYDTHADDDGVLEESCSFLYTKAKPHFLGTRVVTNCSPYMNLTMENRLSQP